MKRLKYILFPLWVLSALVSCDNEKFPVEDVQDQPVMLSVSLDKGLMSRAAIGKGDLDAEDFVINGDYTIFLGLENENLGLPNVHRCHFPDNRNGIIYLSGTNSPLKWSDERLKDKNQNDIRSFAFILDNVPTDNCKWEEATKFLGRTWTDDEKDTYKAQREAYNKDGTPIHTNDIVWGRDTAKYVNRGKEPSIVELTHRMTRINVAFVELDKVMDANQRKGMTVSITNLVQDAEGFNHYDGTVSIKENPERKSLIIKEPEEDLIPPMDGAEYPEYNTANFILPPQPLVVGHWPKVVVNYTDKNGDAKEVSGLIPRDILNESNSWVALDGLNAGNHLTVVVKIDETIPEIIFTAKVKKWKGIGPFSVIAPQYHAGIKNMKELEEVIAMYNSLPVFSDPTTFNVADYNTKMAAISDKLLLYGTFKLENGAIQWTFPINFKLTEVPSPGFRNFMWATENINIYGNSLYAFSYPLRLTSDENTEAELNMLKGEKGIYNIEDLNGMVSTVINDIMNFSQLYGDLSDINTNNSTATYTFKLKDNITGDVIRKLPPVVAGFKMTYNMMSDNNFTVNGSLDVNSLIGEKGIYSIGDLRTMIAAVRSKNMSVVSLYGEFVKDEANKTATCTFDLHSNVTGEVKEKLPKIVILDGEIYQVTYVMNTAEFTVNGSADVNDIIDGNERMPGVYNIDDLNAMIAAVKDNIQGSEAAKYGILSKIDDTNFTATYTFDLKADITGDVSKKLPPVVSGYKMTYVMNAGEFSVNGSTVANTLIGEKGIYSIGDWNAMIYLIQSDPTDKASRYTDLEMSTYTFTFNLRDNVTTTEELKKLPKNLWGQYDLNYNIIFNGFTVNGSNTKDNLIE